MNNSLFLLINAAPDASIIAVEVARLLADGLIWIVPTGLIVGWLWCSSATRQVLIAATISGVAGLLVNQLIGLFWYHPRPFEAGIGQTLITHIQDSSFPSDHLTLIWSIAFSLLLHKQTRFAGWALAMSGVAVAWARIYLGVHFPLDMAGSALVALAAAAVMLACGHRCVPPLMCILMPVHRRLLAHFIARGWVVR